MKEVTKLKKKIAALHLFSFFHTFFMMFQFAPVCTMFLSLFSSESESGSQLPCEQLVSPTALAACMQVDSCFAPWLVPSLGVSLKLAHLELRLCHHLEYLGTGSTHNHLTLSPNTWSTKNLKFFLWIFSLPNFTRVRN